MELFDLSGKVAVITGSSRGIGKAIAERMAEHGARVVISSRKAGPCDEVARAINAKHGEGRAIAVPANIASKEELQRLVDETNAAFGQIDILVCNAGVNVKKPAIDFTAADFDTVIGGNLRAYFLCAQAAARQFIAQGKGGVIVMNSSNASVAARQLIGATRDHLVDVHIALRAAAGLPDDQRKLVVVLTMQNLIRGLLDQARDVGRQITNSTVYTRCSFLDQR